jgi:hypothetical protein
MITQRQSLGWAHGVVTVEALGAMIGPTSFMLPDGRQVAPFHIAPWFAEPLPPGLPGILHRLRGEWPCVPFGADAPRALPRHWPSDGASFEGADIPHGHSSNVDWELLAEKPDAIDMACLYPDTHPITFLHRSVRPDPKAAALDITLTVEARRPCRLPIGLHPTLRLPKDASVDLLPPAFREGRVFPLPVEPSSRLVPDATFQTLDSVPALSGASLSLMRLPLEGNSEDLVQLCGVTGDFVLRYPGEGFQTRLSWNTDHFPSVLLWISNRGRTYAPWNSRHLALGIEPVCSAFDLGPAVSNAANPIASGGTATALDFTPERLFTTSYRIAVEPLEAA